MGKVDKRSLIYTVRNIIIPLYLYSVLFHYIWEMLHMPLYADMPYGEVSSWIACFFATLGDANIVVIIWFIGLLLFEDVCWFKKGDILRISLIIVLGFCIAFFFPKKIYFQLFYQKNNQKATAFRHKKETAIAVSQSNLK